MCRILSGIPWQLFFRFRTRFDPLLAILVVLGGTVSIGEPDQKDKAKIWNLTKNHQKRKKIELTIKMCGISSGIPWQLFFRFWSRFDPLLAILPVLGGTTSIGEPDQKDLAKIWHLTENHQKRKNNWTYHQNVRNLSEIAWQLFFSILDPFWPTFGHFTSSGRCGLCREAGPKRLSKYLKFDQKSPKTKKNRTYHQNVQDFISTPAATFFSILTRFDPLLAILLTSSGR